MNDLEQAMASALIRRGVIRAADFPGLCEGEFAAAIQTLRDAGIDPEFATSSAVTLGTPVSPLHEDSIRALLEPTTSSALSLLDVQTVSASTNATALAADPPPEGEFCAYLADFQWAGKGRRGASWRSPPGSGLCLSVALRLPADCDLSTFSLACGVSVRRALLEAGVPDLQLKWPNDLVANGRKLGGLLVQMRQVPGEAPLMVIGVGINVTAVPEVVEPNALQPVALEALCGPQAPSRGALAAAVMGALWRGAREFGASGFESFDAAWRGADFLHGRVVTVQEDAVRTRGIARGVNALGELLVETGEGILRINAGNVSVRPEGS